jgi:hypothetical protein
MKVSRSSKHVGTFRKIKKMLTFQENTNPKEEGTMHVVQTNIVVLHSSVFKNFKTECSRWNSLHSPFHERGDIFITKYITLFFF